MTIWKSKKVIWRLKRVSARKKERRRIQELDIPKPIMPNSFEGNKQVQPDSISPKTYKKIGIIGNPGWVGRTTLINSILNREPCQKSKE